MRQLIRSGFGLLLCALGAITASAQDSTPLRGTIPHAETIHPHPDAKAMTFRLGRRSGSPSCGMDCAEFIIATGDIRTDTVDDLIRIWAQVRRPLPVYLNSPGGSLEGGLTLGQALRRAGLSTLVGQRMALPCTPATGCTRADEQAGITIFSEARLAATCNSACVYAFAGGVTRGLLPGSTLGIHQFFLADADDPSRTPKTKYSKDDFNHLQRMVSTVAAHLVTMGVSVDVVSLAAQVDAGAIRRLSAREAASLNLTTDPAPQPVAARVPTPPQSLAKAQPNPMALSPQPSAPLPLAPPPAAPMPVTNTAGWPVVTRQGKPFLVISAPTTSRRFGEIATEVALGCAPDGNRYTAAFREIVPSRPDNAQDATVIVGSIGKGEKLTPGGAISRDIAIAASKSGVLELEVTSSATAGHPVRIDLPGEGLQQGLERLDTACAGK